MKEGSDRVYLLHIRDEITCLEENTHDLSYERLDSDKVIQHVAQKSLEIIGEASKKLRISNNPFFLEAVGGAGVAGYDEKNADNADAPNGAASLVAFS